MPCIRATTRRLGTMVNYLFLSVPLALLCHSHHSSLNFVKYRGRLSHATGFNGETFVFGGTFK